MPRNSPHKEDTMFLFIFVFQDKVSCSPDWFQTQYIVKNDTESLILLLLAPKC